MLAINHLINNDKVPFINITQGEKKGYCSLMSPIEQSKAQYVSGFETTEFSLGIIIHGYVEINLEDVIELMGAKYKVLSIKSTPRQDLARKRMDFREFTGETQVLLKG